MSQRPARRTGSRFETVVATVAAYPVWVTILVWILIAQSALYAVIALVGPAIVDGIDNAAARTEVGVMIAGRSIALVILTVIALQSKYVRFLQLVMGLRALIEIFDVIAGLQRSPASGNVPIAVVKALVQLALFVYLGAIASGHVPRYRTAPPPT